MQLRTGPELNDAIESVTGVTELVLKDGELTNDRNYGGNLAHSMYAASVLLLRSSRPRDSSIRFSPTAYAGWMTTFACWYGDKLISVTAAGETIPLSLCGAILRFGEERDKIDGDNKQVRYLPGGV